MSRPDMKLYQDIHTQLSCLMHLRTSLHLSVRQTQEENISMFKSMVASVEKQADASKKQADLAQAAAEHAEAEAKIARRDALFSKILAILAIIVALAAPFLSAYATSIVNMLSQMLK